MTGPSKAPERSKLEGVEKVGYHVDGRHYFTPFAACLRACMAYLGESYTYEYIMGVSGAAFRLMWNSSMWDGGNVDIVCMAEDVVEPIRRAFEATGHAFEHLDRERADEGTFRTSIVESIVDRGRPVLALGVIGPPEACIVTGYDTGGDVLVGWNFFQERPADFPEQAFEPSGCFRKGDWFAATRALFLIGGSRGKPRMTELYRTALAWALKVVRTPMVHKFYGGLNAYNAWAEWMQRDEDFPDDLAILAERKMVHYDAMCMVAERGNAATFLREIAAHHPTVAEDLEAASACYEREMSSLGAMHEATGGFIGSDEKLPNLAEPMARRRIAAAVLRARDADAEAAEHIERALRAIGGSSR